MKAAFTLTAAAVVLLVASSAWAQCPKSRRGGGRFQPYPVNRYPVQRYPVQRYPVQMQTIQTVPGPTCQTQTCPVQEVEPGFGEIGGPGDEEGGELINTVTPGEAGGVVTYEVQVRHPTTFAWRIAKTFNDEALAEEYRAQIENRYWVVYASRSSGTKILEARSLADARSQANALRRVGWTIKAIDKFQVQVAQESLQKLFDGAVANTAQAPQEPKVPNELQPLLGLWEAVTRDADGQLNRILLDLHGDGTADMTVPTAAGGEVKVKRNFAVEEGKFKLTSGKSELVLGNVLEARGDKVVLERGGAKITFLRP